MKKQITITRMTCEGCKAKVTRNIQKLEGVKSVEIDLTNGKTIIDSDALYYENEIQDAIGRD